MANVKISSLPASTTPLAGTEVLPIVQSTVTKQVSVANLTAGRAVSAASLTLSTALPVASGGTGTATPSLVAGTNVTITGTWPNQTVAAASSSGTVTSVALSGGTTGLTVTGSPITTAGTITLAGTLAVANGGTGTASPSLVAGTNITITGTWPNQTVTAASGGGGTVTSVAATVPSIFSISGSPITTSGTLAMTYSGTALPVVNGGTGETSYTNGQLLIGNTTGNTLTKSTLTAGSGITITNGTGSITIAAAGGGGDVFGPASATDNAITRYDGTTGKLIQNSLVTVADDGAIVAPQVGNMIPFYYANQAAFPSAATSHGAWAHSHADGAMFFAHGGSWVRALDADTDVTVAQGGTGLSTLTANNVILGNGTSSPLFVAPGTLGNVLTSNGTTWTSAAAGGGGGAQGFVTMFTGGNTMPTQNSDGFGLI